MTKALVVEDNYGSRIDLIEMVRDVVNNKWDILEANSKEEAFRMVYKYSPDLIFLDIELGNDNSITDFLEKLPPQFQTFKVIFTTLHQNKYIKKAFTFSDINFLDKPIQIEELEVAIRQYNQKKRANELRLKTLFDNYKENEPTLFISSNSVLERVPIKEIVCMEAVDNGCHIHLNSFKKFFEYKSLKIFADYLEDYGFCRTHHAYLVKKEYVRLLDKKNKVVHLKENYTIKRKDGEVTNEIPVSRRRLEEVEQCLKS